MFALIKVDLVIGRTTVSQTHGIKIDAEVYSNLRFDGSKLVDISTLGLTVFYIDSDGIKHIVEGDGWQELECKFNDALVFNEGLWRIQTSTDIYNDLYVDIDVARQSEYTNRVRPFLEEAEIKKFSGDMDEYNRLMNLALDEREKVQNEHPWPVFE
jgi:hypothetical protein